MNGQPWYDLQQAFARFLHLRESSQYINDIVSVVQFDNSARIVHQGTRLSTSVGLARQHSGGTVFSGALDYAYSILNTRAWTQSPVLIFMSDGEAGDNCNDIIYRINRLKNSFRLQVHTVGFGSGAGHGLLSVSLQWKASSSSRRYSALSSFREYCNKYDNNGIDGVQVWRCYK